MCDECEGYGLYFLGAATIGRNIQFANCNFKGGTTGTQGLITSPTAKFYGVQLSNCFITEFNNQGILIQSPDVINWKISDCDIRGNSYTLHDTYDGININKCDNVSIIGGSSGGGNLTITTPMHRYGIAVQSLATNTLISGVNLLNNATASLLVQSPLSTSVSNILTNESLTVSSASTITLPLQSNIVHISGTTTINTIASATRNRGACTLIFNAACTVSETGNVKLGGAFTSTTDDTLTLAFDGTSWFEVSRSIN
jgi:hypothetical protein